MSDKSAFGAEPEQLKRLLTAIGLGESNAGEHDDQSLSSATPARNLIEQPGTQIGHYKLVRMLGEGGMGIAYLAEQQGSIRRRVALKVIKPGMDSKRVLARFEAERQALALLDHPNIAHVFDSGTTQVGRPFFVMEHVKGLPITEHCDYHKLTIEQRLRLFQQVCQAVHHAHQKGIIHRDIKPSNILVSIHEDQAVPKIIDFGVAKAVSQPLTERTLYTEQGQLFGTPEYMSPEQADMVSEDIDTRSDIYSLGVLLYVLLTGVLPFESETLRDGGIDNFRKVIRETDPKTPSTRLTKLGEEARKIAESRRIEVGALAKCLHRELEWIPLKAMRKERAERYRSASEFADDIDNYLKGAPLIAGPPTAGYRLRKSLRRHKTLVGGIAAVLVVSVIGAIVSVTFALGQARARAEAERQAQISQAVTSFLSTDVLGAVSSFKGSEAMTVDVFKAAMAELLDLASKEIEARFQDQPVIEGKIRWQLGSVYGKVNDFKAAAAHLARSYELRRTLFGEEDGRTIYSKHPLAQAFLGAGQPSESERLWKELIETTKASACECNVALAYLAQGRYKDAERLWVKHLGTDKPWWKSWYPKGIPYIEDLAVVYLHQGRYEEAEELFNQFMEEQGEAVIGQTELHRLGYVYMAQGRYKEAADLYARGIEYCKREFLGNSHPLTIVYKHGLAVLHTKQRHYEDAERLFQEILEAMPRRWVENHPFTLEIINAFGVLRREQKNYAEAERLLSRALDGRQRKLGNDHPACFESMHELAVLYKVQGDYDKAEPLLRNAVEGRRLKLGDTHPHTLQSLNNLIELYEAWGKPEEADKWRAKLPTRDDAEKRD
ncbi:MAG: tetratricopeptide repeat protein [Planctomycetota bacterium]